MNFYPVLPGLLLEGVMGRLPYILFTGVNPITEETFIDIFTDDTVNETVTTCP